MDLPVDQDFFKLEICKFENINSNDIWKNVYIYYLIHFEGKITCMLGHRLHQTLQLYKEGPTTKKAVLGTMFW